MLLRWACLMPHPPVLVPQVGMGREKEAKKTLDGIDRLCLLLPSFNDHTVVVASPHFPYLPNSLVIGVMERYYGDLGRFGAPSISADCLGYPDFGSLVKDHLSRGGEGLDAALDNMTRVLDHGTFVPLAILQRSGRRPKRLVPVNPVGLSPSNAYLLGEMLRSVLDDQDGDFGIIFSGDLSHRLSPNAPEGFNPFGREFDDMVIAALSQGDPSGLLSIPPDKLAQAGQCGLNSVLTFMGLAQRPLRVLSYEGPFGVGYAVAVMRPDGIHPYVEFARFVLMEVLRGKLPDVNQIMRIAGGDKALWDVRSGCFVSLYTASGDLRGCIGTLEPTSLSIAFEITKNASAAALEDPRFMPVKLEELPNLRISVDVLSNLEEASLEELNPRIYGIEVRSGNRRGVLLPDLHGVDTVQQQLSIARQKAGIGNDESVKIRRFTVQRYREPS